ncbi:MAG: hypothetical protein WKG00_21620 [Polyangiaceae bacterium]
MSDDELRTLLPGDEDVERALDLGDHERAKRAIMGDPHVRGTLAELRDELRAGESPFRYRPDAPRSDPPEALGPESKRERDTVRGLGNPASQSTPPPPMVAAGAPPTPPPPPPDESPPSSSEWSPDEVPTRADITVGGRTARLEAADAPPSSRSAPMVPAAGAHLDERSYELATIDADASHGAKSPDPRRELETAVASPLATGAVASTLLPDVRARTADAARASAAATDAAEDGEREITGAGASSTSPWVAPVPDAAELTPAARNALDEKDTIRNLTAPTGRGLGALVAGACVACAFVAVLALVTTREGTVATARTGLALRRAPALQPRRSSPRRRRRAATAAVEPPQERSPERNPPRRRHRRAACGSLLGHPARGAHAARASRGATAGGQHGSLVLDPPHTAPAHGRR